MMRDLLEPSGKTDITKYCATIDGAIGGKQGLFPKVPIAIIADEHIVMRQCLKVIFHHQSSLEVAADTGDGRVALELCRKLQPDIVITDLHLASLDGLDVIAQISRRWPRIGVLVLSGVISEARAAEALDAGAQAYVLKQSSVETLHKALASILRNREYVDERLSLAEVVALRHQKQSGNQADARNRLTSRERQVLKLIAEGEKNREIAEKLTISKKTVESHRMNLMQKLEAHNAAELSKWARRLGLMGE
ncbi:response regulator [Paraburkholderia sediminicola]|uniref:response regulator n=1 Tax=Paraburkholderia sediminicola TaxID=458836 RepID=UPI0038BDD817